MILIKLSFLFALIHQVSLFDLKHIYYSPNLVNYLVETNQELFYNDDTKRPLYYEQDVFEKKLNSEIMLRVLFRSLLSINQNNYLNDVAQSYFIFAPNQISLVESVKRLFNQTWNEYCHSNKNKCFELCHSNAFKPEWCFTNHDSKHILKRRHINLLNRKYNLTNRELINDIVNELVTYNMKNNFLFMNNLADTSLNKRISLICKSGFNLNNLHECQDINECNATSNCDMNADCINTFGSYKCKCHKGYLGTGLVNRCFGGTFCSGKFCRMNGKCVFNRNRGGYKCECMLRCLNGGQCVMTQFKYACKCPLNVTGFLCNETLDLYLSQHLLNRNFSRSNETIKLSHLISLVEPLNKNFFLNSSVLLSKYYSILNKFYLLESFKNRTLFNEDIKLVDDKQTSLIQPLYYEPDDYYYY